MKKGIMKVHIEYDFDKDHPDVDYMSKEQQESLHGSFEDIYRFDPNWYDLDDPDSMFAYAKHDMLIVAGGGYNNDHVTLTDASYKYHICYI